MTHTDGDLDRRRFAARLAAGTAALPAMLATFNASGQDQPKATPDQADKEKPAPPPFNPIAIQLEWVVGQYPSESLTAEGLRLIAQKLASQLAHGARLSSFPLSNADGPGFVFSAYRGS